MKKGMISFCSFAFLTVLIMIIPYRANAELKYAQNVTSVIDFTGLEKNTSTLSSYVSKTPAENGYYISNAGTGADFEPVQGAFGKSSDDTSLKITEFPQNGVTAKFYSNGKQNTNGYPQSDNLYSVNWNWAFGDFETKRRVDMLFYNGANFSYLDVNSFSYDADGKNLSDVLSLMPDGKISFFGKLSDKCIYFDINRWYNFEIRIRAGVPSEGDDAVKSVASLYVDGALIMQKKINNQPDNRASVGMPYSIYSFSFVAEPGSSPFCGTTYVDDIIMGKYKSHSKDAGLKSFGDLSVSSELIATDGLHIAPKKAISVGELIKSITPGANVKSVKILDENYCEVTNEFLTVKPGWYLRVWANKLKIIDSSGTEGYNSFDRKIVKSLNRLKISDYNITADTSHTGRADISATVSVGRTDPFAGLMLIVCKMRGNTLAGVDICRVDSLSELTDYHLTASISYEDGDDAYAYLWDTFLVPIADYPVKLCSGNGATVRNGSVVFECEDIVAPEFIAYKTPGSKASGGYALYFPKLNWNLEDVPSDELYTNVYLGEGEEEGIYRLWYRARSTTEKTSSFWWDLNKGTYSRYFFSSVVDGEYRWSCVDIELKANEANYFALRHRSSGYIDKIIITNDNIFSPVGADDMPVYRTEEEKEAYYLSLYPEPPVKPVSGHPRLYVTAQTLKEFKENLGSDSYMSSRFSAYRHYASEDINCRLNTNASDNHNEYLLVRLLSRALMWLTGEETDKAFAEETVMHLKNYIETVRTPDDASDITRKRGNILLTAAVVYDWMYDAITPDDRQLLIDYMMKIVHSKEIGWPPVAMSSISSHAGEYEIFRDLLAAGIAIYDEYPTLYELAAGRMFAEMVPARNWLRTTGRFDVGNDYGETRFYSEVWADATIQAMGYDSIFKAGSNPARWLIGSRMPYGAKIANGDMYSLARSEYDVYYSAYPLALGIAGNLYGDEYVKREYERIRAVNGGLDVFNEFFALVFFKPEVGTKIADDWSYSEYTTYPLSGILARTSWQEGKNSDCALAFMNMHEGYFGDHQNVYTGDFQLYYKGLLAMNTGTYNSSDEHNVAYKRRAIAANVMLCYDPDEIFVPTWTNTKIFNDGGQRTPYLNEKGRSKGAYTKSLDEYELDKNGKISNRDLIVAEDVRHFIGPNKHTPEFSYIGGNLTNAYSDKVTDYHRSMVFMDLFDDGYPAALIVYDKMTSADKSFKKTWLLHSEEKPVITGNKTVIERTKNGFDGKLVNRTLLPDAADISINVVGGENNEMYTFGDTVYAPTPGAIEAGKYRIEISPVSLNKEDIFLNAMYVTTASENHPEPDIHTEQGDGYVGVTLLDRFVTFATEENLMQDSVSVNIRDNGFDTISVLLTDMEEGVWTVSGSGYSINVESKPDENCLYFKAPPGVYTVSKAYDGQEADVFDYPEANKRLIGDFSIWKVTGDTDSVGSFVYLAHPTEHKNGVMYVSCRTLEEFGAVAQTEADNATVSVSGNTINITAGKTTYTLNGVSGKLAYAPYSENGTVYVALSDFSSHTGYSFTYNSKARTVIAKPLN